MIQQLQLDISKQGLFACQDFVKNINDACDPEWLEYKRERQYLDCANKIILSLFDYTGNWSEPYRAAGYDVICLDLKHGVDINDFCVEYLVEQLEISEVYGILAGVPCTDFCVSGTRWWRGKDERGDTAKSIELMYQTLRTIELYNPNFWVIENPVGRVKSLFPELDVKPFYFNPCDYAQGIPNEAYTKKTCLWGEFTPPTIENLGVDKSVWPILGSKMHKQYGGKSERTKELRSATPIGFSSAFYECNL